MRSSMTPRCIRSSMSAAMTAALGDREAAMGELLRLPNNGLAVAYLRAAARLDFHPEICPVPRTVPHHASRGGTKFAEPRDAAFRDPESASPREPSSGETEGVRPWFFASGSALREALAREDWDFIRAAVPDTTLQCLRRGAEEKHLVFPSDPDMALLSRLRVMDSQDFAALPDCGEGLDQALMSAAKTCWSREELVSRVSGKRYPRARVRRICASALLQIRGGEIPDLPDCALIIGVRRGMERLLRPAFPDFALLTRTEDYPGRAPWFQAERRAADLWALFAGLPAGLWERAKLIKG